MAKKQKKTKKKINMKKIGMRLVIFAEIIVLIAALVFVLNLLKPETKASGTSKPFILTPENLPAQLGKSSITKDMPSSAKIQMYFGDYAYYVSGKSVSTGEIEEPDLTIYIPENYLNREWSNFCSIVKTASTYKDLHVEMHGSKAALAFKYKGMLKYKDCL